MHILGNVENGWFAQLAHGVEWAGRGTMNALSFGGQLGDKVYGHMHEIADTHVAAINEQAYQTAFRSAIDNGVNAGSAKIQALQAASQHLEGIANPSSLGEAGRLVEAGTSISAKTVSAVGEDAAKAIQNFMTPDLAPLLIGAGVLAGAYAAASYFGAPAATPRKAHTVH